MNPKGIILTGGPNSCYEQNAPSYTKELFELGIPVLGLCYGAQLMMLVLGGNVERAAVREYGKTQVHVDQSSPLFAGVEQETVCWMSHFDYISKIAPGFAAIAIIVRWQPRSVRTESSTRSSSTPKCCTRLREQRCSITLSAASAAVQAHGEWTRSWRSP